MGSEQAKCVGLSGGFAPVIKLAFRDFFFFKGFSEAIVSNPASKTNLKKKVI